MCMKLGRLRVVDVALFTAGSVKLASMLYSRRVSYLRSMRQLRQEVKESPPSDNSELSRSEEFHSSRENWTPPKWVRMWEDHQMPFHPPLLYRREDDDFSFGQDSYLDDDQSVPIKPKKQMRFKGMFLADSHYNYYKKHLHSHGYAVVDDILYNADGYRDQTMMALTDSEVYISDRIDETYFSQPSFDFHNEEQDSHHYIDDDDWDAYYSFDDDFIRGTDGVGLKGEKENTEEADEEEEEEEEEDNESGSNSDSDICTRPSFYRMYHPTCNEMHSSLSGYQWLLGEEIYARRWKKKKHKSSATTHLSKYLSHGYYRDAFLFQSAFISNNEERHSPTQWDKVIFKTMRHLYQSEDEEVGHDGWGFDPNDKYTSIEYKDDMRKDAMMMELLSSSPHAINIHSHCAMSSVTEFAPIDIEEYVLPTTGYAPKMFMRRGAKNTDLDGPLNEHISPEEKLQIALEMAKCLATMHGFDDGVIAHVDVQISQFFRGQDGFMKIIDYNRAEPLLYDIKNEKYCNWRNGHPGDGSNRAPEENIDAPLTEKIDVYSLGNVFYALLTGKLVWQEYEYEERILRIIQDIPLEIPDLYIESPASHDLVRAIRACWIHNVEERPTIFQVVEFLEEAVAKYPVTEGTW
eukprot:CAMPEP_0183717510 /NCGR_PEP_ID=MMETSP0737-20130205/11110_1 /TAXON_ID=385413 /ORGANISM="Thalassiosira miniscula, Strain CCMP1093" /LENGTH=631 /DNA_ID=CAMNT_0025946973 /DNA_START=240 /DNA_END=2132 /DNA_ORIENTATION=+